MKTVRIIIICVLCALCVCPASAKKKKPLKNIPADTIVIPEDIIFEVMADEIAAEAQEPVSLTCLPEFDITTPILGNAQLDIEQMYRFVKSRNKDFPRAIAEAFYKIGNIYGIRGDIALCQSILETGWFMFTGGTAVKPNQHNYCGLGVTKLGMKGHAFKSIEEGVRAQIQHLYAYACTHSLPKGEKLIDPRFSMVRRGIAPTWADLNRKWAANDHYASRIMDLYSQMANFSY